MDNASSVASDLIKQGVLGTLLVGMAIVAYVLFRALNAERDAYVKKIEAAAAARVADSQQYQAQLLELTRTAVAAITNSTNASLAVKESVGEIRDALADHTDSLREYLQSRAPRERATR